MKQYLRIIIALLLVMASCQMFVGCDLPSDDELGYTEEELAAVKDCFLVPRLITFDRFNEEILDPLKETFGEDLYYPAETKEVQDAQAFLFYYSVYSKESLGLSKDEESLFGRIEDELLYDDRRLAYTLQNYPVVDQHAICILNPKLTVSELINIENIIKTYCPDYTYDDLYYDYLLTDFDTEKFWLKGSNDAYDYAYLKDDQVCAVIDVKTNDPTNIYIPREIDGYKVSDVSSLNLSDTESITFEGTMNEWWEICYVCRTTVHCSDGIIESGQTKPVYEPVFQ